MRPGYLFLADPIGAVADVGAPGMKPPRASGVVLLQVGTALVVPTDGQVYDPSDGAVTVPTGGTDCPKLVPDPDWANAAVAERANAAASARGASFMAGSFPVISPIR